MILVVNRGEPEALNLKSLIEFMDTPDVQTASPSDWRHCLGNERLEAVFIGADLSADDVRTVLDDVGAMDPNVPIVMLHGEDATA